MILGVIFALLVIVLAAAEERYQRPDTAAHTMSASKRRAYMRDRARLNPEMNPMRWRLG